MFTLFRRPVVLTLLGLFLVFTQTACELIRPADEKPHPDQRDVMKSLFFEKDGETPRTFMCGVAPVSSARNTAMRTLNTHTFHLMACNLRFEVTEKYLIGWQINPSTANDDKTWHQRVKIPISSHFILERKKDSRGRATNELIRNTTRSEWSARPYMNLDFANTRGFWNSGNDQSSYDYWEGISADEFEVDPEQGFIGYTVTTTSPAGRTAKWRVNFKAVEPSSGFQPMAWDPSNKEYLNPIFTIGRVENEQPIYYLGRWHLNPNRTIPIALNNWPAELRDVAVESVEDWNRMFTKVFDAAKYRRGEVTRYFEIIDKPVKHTFDLRYPSITWHDDKYLAGHSPLGVAMVNNDVQTGEILWGQVNIYGGLLERLINRYASTDLISSGFSLEPINISLYDPLEFMADRWFAPNDLWTFGPQSGSKDDHFRALTEHILDDLPIGLGVLSPLEAFSGDRDNWRRTLAYNEQPQLSAGVLQQLAENPDLALTRDPVEDYSRAVQRAFELGQDDVQAKMSRFGHALSTQDLRDILGLSSLVSTNWTDRELIPGFSQMSRAGRETALRQLAESQFLQDGRLRADRVTYTSDDLETLSQVGVFDQDRTAMQYLDLNLSAYSSENGLGQIDRGQALRVLVKEILLHELGHFFGLGHNFKAHLLPDPEHTATDIFEELDGKKDEFRNITSVMGYPSGRTVLKFKMEDLKPGHQDEHAVRFLYKGEIPKLVQNGEKLEYEYFKIDSSGIIPRQNAFLPQCDDFSASYGRDPLCGRWQRGWDAFTIVKSAFDDYQEALEPIVNAYTDTQGRYPSYYERVAWSRSFQTYTSVRYFYDFMRYEYRHVFDQVMSGSTAERDLFEFADSCRGIKSNAVWEPHFDRYPELKELCRVNAYALERMSDLVQTAGPDLTKYDFEDSYVHQPMGGDPAVGSGDWGNMWGRYTRLTMLPMKYATLLAATAASPFVMVGPYMVPRPHYANSQTRYLYQTLYPGLYTDLLSANVESNLKFASSGNSENTLIGRSVLLMGALLGQAYWTNDTLKIPDSYKDKLRSLTTFNQFHLVAVIMNKQKRKNDEFRVTHFESSLYDINTRDPQPISRDAYLLHDQRVIVKSPQRILVLPFTKFRWVSNDRGIVFGLKTEYDEDPNNDLLARGVAHTLTQLVANEYSYCVEGPEFDQQNGLAAFFNDQTDEAVFPGFLVHDGIASDEQHQKDFVKSLEESFEAYKKWTGENGEYARPEYPQVCESAMRGINVAFLAAGAINGTWLAMILDYIEK